MKKSKFILAFAAALLFSGCGGSSSADNYSAVDSVAESAKFAEPGISNGYSMDMVSETEEKLVYTGNISIETKDYDKFADEFTGIVQKYKGIVQSMDEESWDNRRTMDMTVRVPAESFDDFIDELRKGSGSVTRLSTNVDNITKRYNDNDMQIASLETQHKRLLELLEQAEDLSDVVMLEERLSDVEYSLNSLKSYKGTMDESVTYSTVNVTIREVNVYTKTTFGKRLKDAFGDSFKNFVEWGEEMIIGVVYLLPFALLAGALWFLLRKPLKAYGEKKRARRAQKKIEALKEIQGNK